MVTPATIKKGYKQTELGEIPEDWDARPIGDFFEFKNGLNKAKGFFGYGRPIVNYMDVYKNRELYSKNIHGRVDVNHQEIKSFNVKKGDVFFTRTSETVEEIGITSVLLDDLKNGVFSGFILRARSTNNDLEDFYKKYCFSPRRVRKQIQEKSTYTTRALTNGRVLSKVKIFYPPKPEQTAIATVLSDTDALIERLEKLIAKKIAIKQGTMQQLLTGKKRLPGFSGEWEVEITKNISSITTGAKNTQDKIDDAEYPFFVRSSIVERINSYSFDGEAVLTAGDGVGTGKVFHYINGKFDFHQRVYKISDFNEKIDGYFFHLFFSNYFLKRIMAMTAKSSVDSVRMEMIAEMPIPLPPRPEQQAIAQILSDMATEIETLEQKRDKYTMLKQGMMQQLLTGKIRIHGTN